MRAWPHIPQVHQSFSEQSEYKAQFMKIRGRDRDKGGRPTKSWYRGWLNRLRTVHGRSEMTTALVKIVKPGRIKHFNALQVSDWFGTTLDDLVDEGVMEDKQHCACWLQLCQHHLLLQ